MRSGHQSLNHSESSKQKTHDERTDAERFASDHPEVVGARDVDEEEESDKVRVVGVADAARRIELGQLKAKVTQGGEDGTNC